MFRLIWIISISFSWLRLWSPVMMPPIELSTKANIMHELDPSRNMPYTPRQTAEISKWYLQKLGYMQGT